MIVALIFICFILGSFGAVLDKFMGTSPLFMISSWVLSAVVGYLYHKMMYPSGDRRD